MEGVETTVGAAVVGVAVVIVVADAPGVIKGIVIGALYSIYFTLGFLHTYRHT